MRISDCSSDVCSSDLEMGAQRERFVKGCAEQSNIPAAKANELFDLIDKFAGYGFNKSHAAAYALLAYQTAWLKAHYPAEFYAASMCFDMHQTDKLCIRSEEHTSELQSLMRISYAVFCLKKKKKNRITQTQTYTKKQRNTSTTHKQK